jgi:hypothetical protein
MSTSTIAAAMPPLKDLRPASATSQDIRAALERLIDARAANAEAIENTEAARPRLLLTATVAELDKTDENLRRRRLFAEQLDLLEPELRKMAAEAKTNEENLEYSEKLAAVKKCADAWNKRLRAEYPALCQAFQPLFAEEAEIWADIEALTRMPGARRVGGENATNMFFASAMMIAANQARANTPGWGMTFGAATRFPPIPDDVP